MARPYTGRNTTSIEIRGCSFFEVKFKRVSSKLPDNRKKKGRATTVNEKSGVIHQFRTSVGKRFGRFRKDELPLNNWLREKMSLGKIA